MTVFDVAEHILRARGRMTAMKLQKLVYYSQAWSLVWLDRPLYRSRIEAWANGPVCPELFDAHRGVFVVNPGMFPGDPDALDDGAARAVDTVLDAFGKKPPEWLSALTHSEAPWKDARKGLLPSARGHRPITKSAMKEFYGGL